MLQFSLVITFSIICWRIISNGITKIFNIIVPRQKIDYAKAREWYEKEAVKEIICKTPFWQGGPSNIDFVVIFYRSTEADNADIGGGKAPISADSI